MQQVTADLRADAGARMQAARDASMWKHDATGDDARRYLYTDGWDRDDAELGWVDIDVVSGSRRMH